MRSDCQNDTVLKTIISNNCWEVIFPLYLAHPVVNPQMELNLYAVIVWQFKRQEPDAYSGESSQCLVAVAYENV